MVVVQLQNALARLEVDVLHTQGHNQRLQQAMTLLNDDINDKMQTIGKYEVCCCSSVTSLQAAVILSYVRVTAVGSEVLMQAVKFDVEHVSQLDLLRR